MTVLQTERTKRAEHATRDQEMPDVAASSDVYADRFGGAVGRFLLNEQTEIVLDLLRSSGRQVLDVGGGHAQLAVPLTRHGYDVTVLGSSLACRRQLDKSISRDDYNFATGSLLNLPFPDQSFDVVLGFRLMAHVNAWPQLIRELCRVSRSAVVVDYTERRSVNALGRMLFPIKLAIEGSTRHYRCHTEREVEQCFRDSAYRVVSVRRQFLFPMALHRGLRCAPLSYVCERLATCVGATQRWGSPAIVMAQRSSAYDRQVADSNNRNRAGVTYR